MHFNEIDSIHELHRYYQCGPPQHPLITIIDLGAVQPERPETEAFYRLSLFTIMCKGFDGTIKYGRSAYDFSEGTLMFMAPHQVVAISSEIKDVKGWALFFHPDLLAGSALRQKIHEYSFFYYDVNEALHVSDEENRLLLEVLNRIRGEYAQNMDRHTHTLINDHLQLLLSYCSRFYDRQFLTREVMGTELVQRFEKLLREYFLQEDLVEKGLPDVKWFASQLHLSPGYLSDLLHRYTGKTTLEYIHLALVDKAKALLGDTTKPVGEIAYELGFAHPSHFTKLFKAKVGVSPRAFRKG